MTSSKPGIGLAEKKQPSVWHKSAPKCARDLECILNQEEAASPEKHQEKYKKAWKSWAKYLRKRGKPLPLSELFPTKTHPLTWALADEFAQTADSENSTDAANIVPVDAAMLRCWLEGGEDDSARIVHAFESLAWCHALPRLADDLSAAEWWALLERLITIAVDASALKPAEDGLVSQLAGGELALSLAYLFPEINVCRKLAGQAKTVLSAGLVDLLDGQGMPHVRELHALRPLLASWTRCRAMGGQLKKSCFTADAENQYQWLIRQALRTARADGSAVFSRTAAQQADGDKASGIELRRCRDLLRAAAVFGDADDRDIFAEMFCKRSKKSGRVTLPEAAYNSEWAAVAVLRPDWSADAPRLAAAYNGHAAVDVELCCGKNVIFSGPWRWRIAVEGKPLESHSDWEEICWFSDEDVDYLEMELSLEKNVVLQRHLLMAGKDSFLLLADSILCDEDPGENKNSCKKPEIEYRAALPLCPGVDFHPAEESNAAMLAAGRKYLARIIPPAFPERRACDSPGSLQLTPDGLELQFSVQGDTLFAPLFFDLDRRRLARPLIWRRLTVAESLEKQADDAAVGYRIQLGEEQWLIYRSLAPQANRTLLGHNLSTEMLVARFNSSGEVEPLIEIE